VSPSFMFGASLTVQPQQRRRCAVDMATVSVKGLNDVWA